MPTIEAEVSSEAKEILDIAIEKGRYENYGEIIEEAIGLTDDENAGVFERGGDGTSVFERGGDGAGVFER